MIDEKKLIEELFYKMPHQFGAKNMEWFRDLIQEQPKIGEWIPCKERLPKKYMNVIADFGGKAGIVIAYRKTPIDDGGQWVNSNTNIISRTDAIAWMPLPEPYKAPAPRYKSNFMERFEKVN